MVYVLARAGRGLAGAYPALGYPEYRLYWGSSVVSLTGMWMQNLAQGWLVLNLTDSPFMLGLVGAFWVTPSLALSLLGGVVADRIDRRRLLIATRTASAVISFAIAALVATGLIEVWHVFAAAALMGAVSAFDMPSSQALVPSLVQPRHLMSAIALISAAFSGTRIVGPSLAGVLVAEFGVAGCYFLAGLGTLTTVAALFAIRVPNLAASRGGGVWTQVREGLSYVRQDELRVTLLAMMLVNSLFGMAYPAMMPVFARDVLGTGAEGYGALMAASGFGSLIGTLAVATFGNVGRQGWIAVGASGAFSAMLVAFALSQSLPLSLILMALMGLFNSVYGTLLSTILQSRLDEEYRGRAMSVFSLAMNTMPLAGLQAGALATLFGAPAALVFNGAVVGVASAVVALFVPRIRRV